MHRLCGFDNQTDELSIRHNEQKFNRNCRKLAMKSDQRMKRFKTAGDTWRTCIPLQHLEKAFA